MTHSLRLGLVSLGAFLAATAPAAPTDDETAVLQADRLFYQATLVQGAEAWAEFAADNVTIDLGRTALHGKTELLHAYKETYAQPGFKLTWDPDEATVVGTLGMTRGHFELHKTGADGSDRKVVGTYITVWRKQEDGTWKFVWDGGD